MTDRPDSASPQSLQSMLDHFVDTTEGEEKVTVGRLLDSLSSRSHGPMLLAPAIIAISPLGMIPGMSMVTGTLIMVIAVQMILFSDRPWIPRRLADFEFSRDKLKQAVSQLRPWISWFEQAIHHRLGFLASGVMVYPIAGLCILLAATFYPLAVVPLGVVVPGGAIALFGLGLTAEDGLLILIGFLLAAVAGFLLWSNWPF